MAYIGNMYGPAFTFLGVPSCDLDIPESYAGADVAVSYTHLTLPTILRV